MNVRLRRILLSNCDGEDMVNFFSTFASVSSCSVFFFCSLACDMGERTEERRMGLKVTEQL